MTSSTQKNILNFFGLDSDLWGLSPSKTSLLMASFKADEARRKISRAASRILRKASKDQECADDNTPKNTPLDDK
jgi:hypothetical protein